MRSLLIAFAALLATGSAALAQNPPKNISRADYTKTLDMRFNAMDANHDGKITRDEMAAAQQRDLQLARSKIAQQLQAKFKQLDTNHDGQLSLAEFMAAAPPISANETPEQLLQRYDSNHDGNVTLDEFHAPELAKFAKVDANHDGVVTPEELKAAAGRR
jgi:Ca2+-binding EF-hand superfamily protein